MHSASIVPDNMDTFITRTTFTRADVITRTFLLLSDFSCVDMQAGTMRGSESVLLMRQWHTPLPPFSTCNQGGKMGNATIWSCAHFPSSNKFLLVAQTGNSRCHVVDHFDTITLCAVRFDVERSSNCSRYENDRMTKPPLVLQSRNWIISSILGGMSIELSLSWYTINRATDLIGLLTRLHQSEEAAAEWLRNALYSRHFNC